MAYTPHVLLAFGGSWTDAAEEVWECTVRLSGDGGGGVTIDPVAYMAAIEAPLRSWFSTNTTFMDPKAKLTFLKVNHVGADGKYVDTGITHVTDLAPTLGGSTHTMPGYCSVAYTWETAVKRGPGHRGRIYPPNAAGLEVLHAFTMSDASATASATAGAALLTILKNASGANGTKGKPVVASKIGGQLVTITGVSVDNIFDIQSRRKNRIKATRSAIVAI